MADLFDYLRWRGDIPISMLGVNPVDALIFSALSYVNFTDFVPTLPGEGVPLETAARQVLSAPDAEGRVRVRQDLTLLAALAESKRFAGAELTFYQDVLLPQEQTQFAAVTACLEDGSALVAFRGTDHSMVGWKEDFNMCFQDAVPAQIRGMQYVQTLAGAFPGKLLLTGHSKGGNVAVYAASLCAPWVQDRIQAVFNQDGPGFTEKMLRDPGYRRMVPKIRTYVPQSSLIGMLVEHDEPFTVIHSRQIGGVMQHDPYTWEVLGPDLVRAEETTADSQFLDKTIKAWLAGMTQEQRNAFFDSLYTLLTEAGADYTNQLAQPRRLLAYVKTLSADPDMRNLLFTQLVKLYRAARGQWPGRTEEG